MAAADTGSETADEYVEDELDDTEGDFGDDSAEDEAAKDEAAEDGDGSDETGDEAEALDKLEAEELEMLTEDEAAEALPIDEAQELRQLRREAMSLEVGPEATQADEFVCSNCFLVKRTSQLANRRKKLCNDCA